MSKLPFFGGIYRKRHTWSHHLVLSKTFHLSLHLNKHLGLGMRLWILFFSNSDPNVHILWQGNELLLLALYVVDLILNGSSPTLIDHVKSTVHQHFNTTNLGLLYYFLWLQITQSASRIGISQPKYALGSPRQISHVGLRICTHDIFVRGQKVPAKCSTPLVNVTLSQQLVGSLLY